MKYINSAIFTIAILAVSSLAIFAQESETKVVDEVVAQVNDSVITLSQVKREMNEAIDSTVKEGKQTPDQARAAIESKKGELIAGIVNEELLMQKGKEAGVDSEVEGQINQRFLEIMKQQNVKTLDALYKAMEASGVNQEDIRNLWRKQITREIVLNREVDSKLYLGWTAKEIKAYYEANKAKFTKPETITISEIFLNFAGRDKEAVREKAKQLVQQARGGADFGKLAEENSDRENVKETKGKAGALNVKDLDKIFAEPLKDVKVGGITEPIEIAEEGIEIFRVDERSKASVESFYDETEVRKAMTYEKLPAERKKFMTNLRQDAYIKISETYRPLVSPLLFADDRQAEVKKGEK
ncbi:MAG: peptidyl-prolyl cis-trans isomerase [Pyrinomonadaceae bacterium]|nr:peptidyl-prolyl cis-trans isomerase [Pyrinomonadaceae bacterium]